MFLVYPQGIRIIVHTANLIYVDWNNKSQGLWMQDFPWKHGGSDKGSGFESDLIDYLSALKVRLIAFVPGYHSGSNIKKWGHMKIRSVLQDCVFDKEMGTHEDPFSSIGSNIYQADVETDEVYAQMTLQPLTPQEQKDTLLPVELGTLSR
ncbi:putative phosphodiesterase I [Helianthus annuus]|nr:putative phosphodiesterase I [Helianthus annuus]